MRKIVWTFFVFWLCGLLAVVNAETYPLTDGSAVTGDIVSFNDDGIIFRSADDKYTDRIPWAKFSQDALKTLSQNPKINPFAEPFIETPPPVLTHKTEVQIHNVSRLDLPPNQSVIGGLFSSSIGIVVLLLIYAANIYAGFEVAIFRARPVALVAGIAALLPILGPIIFLSMPAQMEAVAPEDQPQDEAGPVATASAQPVPEDQPATAGGLHVTATSWQSASPVAHPEPQIFQRGQFTFNRRFFETKFSSFFGVVRHGADKDMVLLVKTPRAQHVVQRITRIAANEAYFEVAQGAARQEVMVPFAEIQEIQLKHKDA